MINNIFKTISYIENLKGYLRFYRYNPDKIPVIKGLLCKMGRHDFEAIDISSDNSYDMVELECFYCHKRKINYL